MIKADVNLLSFRMKSVADIYDDDDDDEDFHYESVDELSSSMWHHLCRAPRHNAPPLLASLTFLQS